MRKCDTWCEGRHIHQNVSHVREILTHSWWCDTPRSVALTVLINYNVHLYTLPLASDSESSSGQHIMWHIRSTNNKQLQQLQVINHLDNNNGGGTTLITLRHCHSNKYFFFNHGPRQHREVKERAVEGEAGARDRFWVPGAFFII